MYFVCRVYPDASGWELDKPAAERQSYGRCVQCGKRKFYAGNKVDGERILGQSAYTLLLRQKMEQRLD